MELVNVILPVYNGGKYLDKAIQSITGQNEGDHRIILVDDGSTDQTELIARSYDAVEYYYQENKGPGSAMNLGISKVEEGYLAFLDADDMWQQNKTARQLAQFRAFPETDMVFGKIKQFHSPELSAEEKARLFCPDELFDSAKISMLIKYSSFKRVGNFIADKLFGEFVDWLDRANQSGLIRKNLEELLALRRLHTSNLSITHRGLRTEFAHVLKRSIDRKRGKHEKS